jgi:hypothetical protein
MKYSLRPHPWHGRRQECLWDAQPGPIPLHDKRTTQEVDHGNYRNRQVLQ